MHEVFQGTRRRRKENEGCETGPQEWSSSEPKQFDGRTCPTWRFESNRNVHKGKSGTRATTRQRETLLTPLQKVADSINDVEEFGDLPQPLLLRLSQILSKRRVITQRTLRLFLRPNLDSISIYDCASRWIRVCWGLGSRR